MKKILIYTTRMSSGSLGKVNYKTKESKFIETPVCFAMNTVIPFHINSGDDVEVVIIKNIDLNNPQGADEVAGICKKECIEVLSKSNAKISFTEISFLFDISSENIKKCYLSLIKALEKTAEIYVDVTFGAKFVPFVLFSALNYAEKYFDSSIKNIYYGQVSFDKNNAIIPGTQELFSFLSVYSLNSFSNSVDIGKDEFKFLIEEMFI